MDPRVPAPPRDEVEGELETPFLSGPPTTTGTADTLALHAGTQTQVSEVNTSEEVVHKVPSEEDIPMYGTKVHVHGPMAGHAIPHPPHHHDPHAAVNYAKAAKEEMHDLHEHPPAVAKSLVPGAKTGVEEWDKVMGKHSYIKIQKPLSVRFIYGFFQQ